MARTTFKLWELPQTTPEILSTLVLNRFVAIALTAEVVETSVTVKNNSPIQDYVHLHDQTQPTFEMTPGFKPFTDFLYIG